MFSLLFLTALETGKFIWIKIFYLYFGRVLSIHRILVKHWKYNPNLVMITIILDHFVPFVSQTPVSSLNPSHKLCWYTILKALGWHFYWACPDWSDICPINDNRKSWLSHVTLWGSKLYSKIAIIDSLDYGRPITLGIGPISIRVKEWIKF